jgi:hypothetical protein
MAAAGHFRVPLRWVQLCESDFSDYCYNHVAQATLPLTALVCAGNNDHDYKFTHRWIPQVEGWFFSTGISEERWQTLNQGQSPACPTRVVRIEAFSLLVPNSPEVCARPYERNRVFYAQVVGETTNISLLRFAGTAHRCS